MDMSIAIDSIKQIIDILQIAKVVSVDDYYNNEIEMEDIVGLICDEKTNSWELIPGLNKENIQDTYVARAKIANYFEVLDEASRDHLKKKLKDIKRTQQNSSGQNDVVDMQMLQSLFNTDKLVTLSLADWEANRETLLRESKDQKTLFLFDQDMGNESDGIRLISGLLAGKENHGIVCGLLTYHVQPEDLPDAKDRLSEEYNISIPNRDRFMVIPKRHLPEDPILFAQIMKLLALSADFSDLKNKAKSIYEFSLQQASEEIDKINIYDLDHIIFHSVKQEGLWEPDMLFRLFSLFQRLKARELAYDTTDLELITQKIRKVSHVPAPIKNKLKSNIWLLQRQELYDQQEFVNKNHLPLEIGDIFRRTSARPDDPYFILLAQPCDLMVRSDGKRAFNCDHLTLAKIELIPDEKLVAKKIKQLSFVEELEYFDENPDRKWYVLLNRTYHVWACILDLCVFNSLGNAVFTLNSTAPSELKPSWAERHKAVNRHIVNIKNKLQSKIVHKDQWVDFITDSLFKATYRKERSKETISFNCSRVSRLTKERAFGLLMSYTSVLGRPGYDKDFGVRDLNV